MIKLYKRYSSLLSVISVMVLISAGLIGLTACETSDSANSTTTVNNSSSSTTYSDTAISTTSDDSKGQSPDNKITYDDQIEVEKSIEAFANALEKREYTAAEEYCAPDFKEYIANLTSGKGAVTDTFSMAIVEGLPIKLISVKGYYDEGEKGLNYNITRDKLTVHFLVSFEIQKSNGDNQSVEGYTQGVKDTNGKWRIEGFASGR